MKVVFFGTSNVALPVLESLAKNHQILAVVTQPDAKAGRKQEFAESPVSVLAKEMKLEILKPEKIRNNPQVLEQLKTFGADIFVVVSYGKILPAEVINLPPLKTVNVHFSLLPKYRGGAPIQYALLDGVAQTGISIFILDESVDHGPLLYQEPVMIDSDDNYITLSQKLAQISGHVISGVLADYKSGKIQPLPQDHSKATETKIIEKVDGQIDWQKSAAEIYNQFRAFYPWPGIWTKWDGKLLKIIDCLPAVWTGEGQPGTVMEQGVLCGQGTALQINQLQLEGKTEVSLESFLNGYKDFTGSRLG